VPLGDPATTTVNGLYLLGGAHSRHAADTVYAVVSFASGLRVFFHPESAFAKAPLATVAASVGSTVVRVEIIRDGDRVLPRLPPPPSPPAAPLR
jgi:hypothetical protein